MLWTGRGLEPRSIRPAFEVVFVYDERERFLDVYVKGGKRSPRRFGGSSPGDVQNG